MVTRQGDELVDLIIKNRPYADMEDFQAKVKVNVLQMLNLITAGAFDELYPKNTREDTMKEFKFVCEEEILARVAMPKDYTICMSAFTKTELKKRIPEITDYRESDNFVYGIRKIWKLKEC